MKLRFLNKKFNPDALAMVEHAVGIIESYKKMGFTLTLRQLYYQFVAGNLFPDDRKYAMQDGKWVRTPKGSINAEPNYKWLGDIIGDARMAGIVDWGMIEDRGRITTSVSHWDSPRQILEAAASGYQKDKWREQPNYIEVMVEKQALEGILEPVCGELGVRFTANKGYSSQTALFNTGQRLKQEFLKRAVASGMLHADKGRFPLENHFSDFLDNGITEVSEYADDKTPVTSFTRKGIEEGWPRIGIIYFGDHDPSGIDMTRDVAARLSRMSDFTPIEVHRVALNMEQVEKLNPPENPAKETDSRAASYIAKFGNSSWELDAVKPDALATMVRDKIMDFRDEDQWDESMEAEDKDRAKIAKAIATIKG